MPSVSWSILTDMENTDRSSHRTFLRGTLPVFLAGCLWGTAGLFNAGIRAAGFSSFDITFLRALCTFLCFGAVIAVRHPRRLCIRLRDVWCFLGTGVASMAFFNVCYFLTMERTTLAMAVMLMETSPIFVVLLSAVLFRERLNAKKLIAVGLTIVGCALMCDVFGGGTSLSPSGVLIGLASGLGYALYSIFSRFALLRGYHSETISFYTFLFAALAMIPFTHFDAIGAALAGGTFPWLIVVGYGLITMITYYLYTAGLTVIENGKAAICAMSEPPMAALLGVIFLHDPLPGILQAAGMLLMLGAIVLLNTKEKGRKAKL